MPVTRNSILCGCASAALALGICAAVHVCGSNGAASSSSPAAPALASSSASSADGNSSTNPAGATYDGSKTAVAANVWGAQPRTALAPQDQHSQDPGAANSNDASHDHDSDHDHWHHDGHDGGNDPGSNPVPSPDPVQNPVQSPSSTPVNSPASGQGSTGDGGGNGGGTQLRPVVGTLPIVAPQPGDTHGNFVPPAPPPVLITPMDGNYRIVIKGALHGSGTANVSNQSVSITATVQTSTGVQGTLNIGTMPLVGNDFTGSGTACNQTISVVGRLEPPDNIGQGPIPAEIICTFTLSSDAPSGSGTSAQTHGRIAGYLVP